jgi:CheY-like chemotaxis protein/HPt (histidine-containing phosphotransfer) domain-containing protein
VEWYWSEAIDIVCALMDSDMAPVRILVVDDDAVSREVIALHLAAAGYAVETAESGDAALLRLGAAGSPPGVVLTDLQMPGIAGAELGRRLREVCGAGTLLLAMSGSEPEEAVRREFDGFLSKPFAIGAVAAAIAGFAASAEGVGTSERPGSGRESGRALHDAPHTTPSASWRGPRLSDDETVAKMGHKGSMVASETAVGVDGTRTTLFAIPALNEAVYRKLAGAMRRERLEQLYALCLSDAEARIVAMRRSASDGDDVAYRKEAHAIKGGCGMMGALELQSLATSMEERGLDDANHVASLDEFMLSCERLRRILVARASEEKDPETEGEDTR